VFGLWLAGCGGDPSGPGGGDGSTTIVVSVTTTGVRLDPDGYSIILDDGPPRPLDTNGSVTLPVESGPHTVRVEGRDLNCVLSSAPTIPVLANEGRVTRVDLDVECGYLVYARTGSEILVLESVTNSVVDTIPHRTGVLVVSPDNRTLYATADRVGPDSLLIISTDTHEVERRIPLPESAGGFRISPDGRRMLMQHGGSALPGEVSVFDLETGAVLANEQLIAAGVLFSDVEMSADASILYSLAYAREIIAWDWTADQIVHRIPLGSASLQGVQMEFSPDRSTIYVMSFDSEAVNSMENVTRVDASTGQALETTPVTGDPNDMRLTPDGREIWVTHSREAGIAIVDVDQFIEVANIPDVPHPLDFEFTPDGAWAYVTNRATREVLVVSVAQREIVERLSLGSIGIFAFAGDRR
jgi:DNA-binding beta-propeller fold protein YncE